MQIAPHTERVLGMARQFRKAPDEIGTRAPARGLVCAGCDAPVPEPVPVAEIHDHRAPAIDAVAIR